MSMEDILSLPSVDSLSEPPRKKKLSQPQTIFSLLAKNGRILSKQKRRKSSKNKKTNSEKEE